MLSNDLSERAQAYRDFLSRFGLEEDRIKRHVEIPNPDCILVAGSVVDGVGTSESDIDLYVFSDDIPSIDADLRKRHIWAINEEDREESGLLWMTQDSFKPQGPDLQIKYYPKARLIQLQQELDELYHGLYQNAHFDDTSFESSIQWYLTDRVGSGIAFNNAPLNPDMEIPSNQLRWVGFLRYVPRWQDFKRIKGAFRDGNTLMANVNVRTFLSQSYKAYLCLRFGRVNIYDRWLPEYAVGLSTHLSCDASREFLDAAFRCSDNMCSYDTRVFLRSVDKIWGCIRTELDSARGTLTCRAIASWAEKCIAEYQAMGRDLHPELAKEEKWWTSRFRNPYVQLEEFL